MNFDLKEDISMLSLKLKLKLPFESAKKILKKNRYRFFKIVPSKIQVAGCEKNYIVSEKCFFTYYVKNYL